MCEGHGILLSFIVPVYNAETFLANCLDSLLGQNIDREEYEIICINDGSTDGSPAILKEYADRYHNIRVVDKPNGGVSSARNTGLRLSQGQYVWFVDADDWIARDSLGEIKQTIEKCNPSIVKVRFDWIKADWRIRECIEKPLNESNVVCEDYNDVLGEDAGAWSIIISKKLLNRYGQNFMEHLHYGEDILFVRDLFDRSYIETEKQVYSHRVVYLQNETFYYYRMHDDSAMSTSWTKNREKYAEALLDLARIDKKRMTDESKPDWYTEKYAKLFAQRMYNYMMYWFPGLDISVWAQLNRLKKEKLYPVSQSVGKLMQEEVMRVNDSVEQVKRMFQYMAFRLSWLYPLYYWQMKKKYNSQ